MFETLAIMPISFWVVIALLIGGGLWAFQRRQEGFGLPLMAVLGTVAAWYVGDALYNDYTGLYAKEFTSGILALAWWQVAWFILLLLLLVPLVHRWMNRSYLNRRSGVLVMFAHGVDQPVIQEQLNVVFWGAVGVWLFLFMVACLALKGQIIYYICPFLGYRASPWVHNQIGHGFQCFSVLAIYLQLLSTTMFGVVAALATNRRIRRLALLFCLVSWPFFVFARTRNSMLVLAIPAVLAWIFLRLRGGFIKKGAVLLVCFCVVNMWMKFVIANRSQMSITQAFAQKGLNLDSDKHVHNEGLNMFEELCWISTFLDNGKYQINWGGDYFAELVNPIPRAIWPGKPLIGLKYAIARGHHVINSSGAVDTTISTGMIGQGVTNFGRVFGPLAAALLMSFWVAWLARMDLNIHKLGHLPLYGLGLILTFNMGRDITFIVLYPFIFGAMAIWCVERYKLFGYQPVSAAHQGGGAEPGSPGPSTNRAKNLISFDRHSASGGFVKRKTSRHMMSKPRHLHGR